MTTFLLTPLLPLLVTGILYQYNTLNLHILLKTKLIEQQLKEIQLLKEQLFKVQLDLSISNANQISALNNTAYFDNPLLWVLFAIIGLGVIVVVFNGKGPDPTTAIETAANSIMQLSGEQTIIQNKVLLDALADSTAYTSALILKQSKLQELLIIAEMDMISLMHEKLNIGAFETIKGIHWNHLNNIQFDVVIPHII